MKKNAVPKTRLSSAVFGGKKTLLNGGRIERCGGANPFITLHKGQETSSNWKGEKEEREAPNWERREGRKRLRGRERK